MTQPPDFKQAIDRRDFDAARSIASTAPDLDLLDALDLTLLAAEEEPTLYSPLARRWLARFVYERAPRPAELQQTGRVLGRVREGAMAGSEARRVLERIVESGRKRRLIVPMRSAVGTVLAACVLTASI